MAKKKAIIGFDAVNLAPITTNTAAEYTTEAAFVLPAAGQLTRTAKENSGEVYYDDEIYAQVNEVLGEEAELRLGEISLEDAEKLGYGTLDTNGVLEADFTPDIKQFSLRCRTETIGRVPYYFKWRVFETTGVRFDNFKTKANGVTVAEVIVKGLLKRPEKAELKAHSITQLKDDGSNATECAKFLTDLETTVVSP